MDEKELQAYLIRLRRIFHSQPELGFHETQTSRRIQAELASMGISFKTFCETGVLAEIPGGKPGGRVLLRADIDALPIQEETGVKYASQTPCVMHACGHDAHAAMLLGAASLLQEQRASLAGTVQLLFEPAEEIGGVARQLVKAGELKDVDTVFALHVTPDLPTGQVSVQPGVRMAGCGFFRLVLRGQGGHGAAPHCGVDVIPAVAATIQNLQTIISREIDPLETAVLSVGTLQAGTVANAIADTAELSGTFRFHNPELMPLLRAAVERVVNGTALAYRVTPELKCSAGLPPAVNDPLCTKIARQSALSVFGAEGVAFLPIGTGSDDFACLLERTPGVYAFLGTKDPKAKVVYPLHHPKFCLDETALLRGSQLYTRYVLDYLEKRVTEDEKAARSI